MATITATEFKAIINDAAISATNAEYILNLAIDTLNLYGADLSNMTGTAGSQTLSVESKEKGAILNVARAIYYSFYKGIDTAAIASLTASSPDVMANPTVMQMVKEAARELSELDVAVG